MSIARGVLAQTVEPEGMIKCLTIIQIELEFGNVVFEGEGVTDGNASGLAPPTAGVREQWHNRHEFVDARSGLKRTFITVKP